jgi:tetratricopeptide (TPR) repeat protein
MDKSLSVKPPSVGELVRAISQEAKAKLPQPPMAMVLQIPTPHPLSRLLVIMAVALIAILAVLLLLMMYHVNGLMSQIRIDQELRANPPMPPLPTAEELLDDNIFSIALLRNPKEAMRLYCARGETLLRKGDAHAAISCYDEANVRLDNDLPASSRIELSRAYFQIGKFENALSEVRALDFAHLSPLELESANDVLSRVLFAQQQRENRRVAQNGVVSPNK